MKERIIVITTNSTNLTEINSVIICQNDIYTNNSNSNIGEYIHIDSHTKKSSAYLHKASIEEWLND